MSGYVVGEMCPFVMAEVGGGFSINGTGGSTYTWKHTQCMKEYCRLWKAGEDGVGCRFEFLEKRLEQPPPPPPLPEPKPTRPTNPVIENDLYKLYLVEKHAIAKHAVIGRFLLGGKLYDSVDDALEAAHVIETEQMSLEKEQSNESVRVYLEVLKKLESQDKPEDGGGNWGAHL